MEKSSSKNNYLYIVLGIILVAGAIAWAFFTGRRDGAEHRRIDAQRNANQSNQNVNQTP